MRHALQGSTHARRLKESPEQARLPGTTAARFVGGVAAGNLFSFPMKTRHEVVAMARAKIRLRHFAYSTEQSYCGWVARYYDYCLRLPPALSPEKKAEAFLGYLAIRQRVSPRTQNQALSALLLLYASVLERPLGDIDGLRAKQRIHERTAPSREQVRVLRAAVVDRPGIPARLLVDLLYGCGLRVSEPLELRIKDILWEERQLVVRAAKGAKDRRVPIPASCLEPLRTQVEMARFVWEEDRKLAPQVGVPLPHQLAKKYRSAPYSWAWFWVFPARGHCSHPRTGVTVRYHLLHDRLQQAVREAARKVGLEVLSRRMCCGMDTPPTLARASRRYARSWGTTPSRRPQVIVIRRSSRRPIPWTTCCVDPGRPTQQVMSLNKRPISRARRAGELQHPEIADLRGRVVRHGIIEVDRDLAAGGGQQVGDR